MKKVNEKFQSVRIKLFSTLTLIVILIILLLIIMNSLILETFYTISKILAVKKEFYEINELYKNETETIIIDKIKRDSISNNFDILIENEQYMLVFSTNEKFTNVIKNEHIPNIFNAIEKKNEKTLHTEDNMVIKKVNFNRLNSILLLGKLDNGYRIYIQIPIAAIKESVKISNNLLIIIGLIAIIVAGIAVSYVSKKFTNPILELNMIANKMSKLDFSKKYELTDSNDEINELGNSINIMSEKLEKTIKQLRSSNIQLERDIEKKSKIDEMRKQFISDVSHELKTPIALIQGYAEGLLENVNVDPESRKYYTEVIIEESNRMDKLVRQLLELTKLEYGKKEFNNSKFNICELIKEVVRKCDVMIKEKEIKDVRFNFDKEELVFADEFYIDQAFTNYFTNAIKHTKEVEKEKYIEIRLKENKEQKNIRVSVINTGDKLEEEELERIWGRFYKVDASRNRADGGSGIGLALVKAIMNNYNSEYGARNVEKGIEFYFDIPMV